MRVETELPYTKNCLLPIWYSVLKKKQHFTVSPITHLNNVKICYLVGHGVPEHERSLDGTQANYKFDNKFQNVTHNIKNLVHLKTAQCFRVFSKSFNSWQPCPEKVFHSKNTNYIKKRFKQKLLKTKFRTKNINGRICLSPPGVELEARKIAILMQ